MIMPMLMFYVDADDKAHDDDETYDNMVLRMMRHMMFMIMIMLTMMRMLMMTMVRTTRMMKQ